MWCTIFLSMFISILYMFWATMYPSSGELTVSMRLLVFVSLYGWLSGMQGGMKFHSTLHTRQSSIQNNKYQVLHRYSQFSWWWAHSCPKHVEKKHKRTKKNCAPNWLYLQDYKWTQLYSSFTVYTLSIIAVFRSWDGSGSRSLAARCITPRFCILPEL